MTHSTQEYRALKWIFEYINKEIKETERMIASDTRLLHVWERVIEDLPAKDDMNSPDTIIAQMNADATLQSSLALRSNLVTLQAIRRRLNYHATHHDNYYDDKESSYASQSL